MSRREPEWRRRDRKTPQRSLATLWILIALGVLTAGGVTTAILLVWGGKDDSGKKAEVPDIPLKSMPPQTTVFPNVRGNDPLVTNDALRNVLASLDRSDPGWRLVDLEARRPNLDPGSNGAVLVHTAAYDLPRPMPEGTPTSWNNLRHGWSPNEIAIVRERLTNLAPSLKVARKLKDYPQGRFRLEYSADALSTKVNHAQEVRSVGILLKLDTLLAVEEGDAEGALESCRAAVNNERTLADEPLTLTQLVRIALLDVTLMAVERSLSLKKGPSADNLLALHRALAVEANEPFLTKICRGERATMHFMLTNAANGDAFPEGGAFGADEHAQFLEIMNKAVRGSREPPRDQTTTIAAVAQQRLRASRRLQGIIPDIASIRKSCQRINARLHSASLALAAERYRLRYRRWPSNLAALVPDYVTALPVDPYHGKPFLYAIQNGDVLIFCSSRTYEENARPNLFDAVNHPSAPWKDWIEGFRLLSPNHRR